MPITINQFLRPMINYQTRVRVFLMPNLYVAGTVDFKLVVFYTCEQRGLVSGGEKQVFPQSNHSTILQSRSQSHLSLLIARVIKKRTIMFFRVKERVQESAMAPLARIFFSSFCCAGIFCLEIKFLKAGR